jgi:hypothetical protein
LRVIELLPTRVVGVIADHGDFPIERIAIDHAGEGRWVGSVGHDEVLRLTDLREVLEDEDERDTKADDGGEEDTSEDEAGDGAHPGLSLAKSGTADDDEGGEEQESGDESDVPKPRKRQKKDKKDLQRQSQKKGKNQVEVDPSFFSGL